MRVETRASVTGTVWKITKAVGDRVEEGDEIMVLESMKMEIPVQAAAAGRIGSIEVKEQGLVDEDQVVAIIEADS